MNTQTKTIIQKIAQIQIDALTNIEKGIQDNMPERRLVETILQVGEDESSSLMREVTKERIDFYSQVKEFPSLIGMLDEYQLYLCSHILFRMEEQWIQDNPEGVIGAWNFLFHQTNSKHPETVLLWK